MSSLGYLFCVVLCSQLYCSEFDGSDLGRSSLQGTMNTLYKHRVLGEVTVGGYGLLSWSSLECGTVQEHSESMAVDEQSCVWECRGGQCE